MLLVAVLFLHACDSYDVSFTVEGDPLRVFHGIPPAEGWGEDYVFEAPESGEVVRSLGSLGGIPVVDVWGPDGGTAVVELSDVQQPMEVRVEYEPGSVTVSARGAPAIETWDHEGDWYDLLRRYAERMDGAGVSAQAAPEWAFDPIWETYGFEEDWDRDDVRGLLPVLRDLGVGTITLDSGWYGEGRGGDWDSCTGDFPVNGSIVGSEEELDDFVKELHDEGFNVRLWWTPGVAERGTDVYEEHLDWFLGDVESSWGGSGDIYADPTRQEVVDWTLELVDRFLDYGADGFKQDDVYVLADDDVAVRSAWAALFRTIWETAVARRPEFTINTCNCGIAQSLYLFPGQNQLITSDPVRSRQLRLRGKTLKAFDLHGTAVLGDHAELTLGDVGPDDLREPGFYDGVDFASIVPLGLVLETKLTEDPGLHYRDWFRIYREERYYEMEWVNVPWVTGVETYLLRRPAGDGGHDSLFFAFFDDEPHAAATLSHLEPGVSYSVRRVEDGSNLASFTADDDERAIDMDWEGSLVIAVEPR